MKTTLYGIRVATILLVIYWIAVFTATHLPKVGLPSYPNADKIAHFVAFSGLAFLMAWAIPTRRDRPRWNVLVAAIVCLSYGAFDEFTQIPAGRTADIQDWFADCLGTTFGLTIYLISRAWLWRRQQFSPNALPTPR